MRADRSAPKARRDASAVFGGALTLSSYQSTPSSAVLSIPYLVTCGWTGRTSRAPLDVLCGSQTQLCDGKDGQLALVVVQSSNRGQIWRLGPRYGGAFMNAVRMGKKSAARNTRGDSRYAPRSPLAAPPHAPLAEQCTTKATARLGWDRDRDLPAHLAVPSRARSLKFM